MLCLLVINIAYRVYSFHRLFMLFSCIELSKNINIPVLNRKYIFSFHLKKGFHLLLYHPQLLQHSLTHLFIGLELAQYLTPFAIEDITKYLDMPVIFVQIMIWKELKLLGFNFPWGTNFPLNKLRNTLCWRPLINVIN